MYIVHIYLASTHLLSIYVFEFVSFLCDIVYMRNTMSRRHIHTYANVYQQHSATS